MDEVPNMLAQIALWVGGAWSCYVCRVKKIDERRAASWASWLRKPLREPPPRTDWDAFERRVARDLAADLAEASTPGIEHGPTADCGWGGRSPHSRSRSDAVHRWSSDARCAEAVDMKRKGQKGEPVDDEVPVWEPLKDAVGDELVGWFMWMYWIRLQDGTAVHAYKHRSTRRYLFLDDAGRSYGYDDGRYPLIPLSRAIDGAFASWPALGGTRLDIALVDDAWDRARRRETDRDGRSAV